MFVRRKTVKRMRQDIDYLYHDMQYYREMSMRSEELIKYLKASLDKACVHIKEIESKSYTGNG